MKSKLSTFNEKLYFSKEISNNGAVATVKLLRGNFVRFLNFLGRSLAYSSTRSYGCFILSFGLLSLFLNLGEYYFSDEPEVSVQLITGAIFACIAIPLLVFEKPMCIALQDFAPTDYIFFEFLSMKRMHRNVTHVSVSPILALFLGFIPAIVGFFVPVFWVILVSILAVIIIVALITPEFPMILTLLLLPYLSVLPHSNTILAVISGLSFFSFALKVILGKRVYNFDIYDAFIWLAVLFIFIGGAAGGAASFKTALKVIFLLLGYFPASNLIINRRLADCAINAIVVSSVPISVIAIIDFISKKSVVSVFFAEESALAAYLLVSSTLALVFAVQKHLLIKKAVYFAIFFIEVFVLGTVIQPAVWLTFLLAATAYFIITSRKAPIYLVLLLIILPYSVFLIPGEKLDTVWRVLKITPLFSEKLTGYAEAFWHFYENPQIIAGIGGKFGVGNVYLNTPLGVLTSFGILVFVIFFIVMLVRINHLSYFRHYVRNSPVNVSSNMSALAIFVLLIYGVDYHIFSNSCICYMFWVVFAISTSTLRIAKKEYQDRLGYYGHSRSSDSSVIDVDIR